jgi:biotin/methionine sulfoxide reductase
LIEKHTDNLIIFGGINPKNSQVSMGGSTEHDVSKHFNTFGKMGKNMVSISPQKDDSPKDTSWLPIMPGTDVALMLGIAHVLETEKLADQLFLSKYCSGYELFKQYFLGTDGHFAKTPEWASDETGIDASEIRKLARNMASGRTLISVSWSLQRARYGEHPFWMACVLAAMLGQIGLPGGGIGFGYGAIGNIGKTAKRMQGPLFEQGTNPISDFIPVSRIADMLLNPGGSYNFNGEKRVYPDIKLVYWCGGNPFHHHQDLNRLNKAWQYPETIIVHEPWWTATAKRADIVFPATTQFERSDIGWAKGDPYIFYMPQMISPVGLAKNDYDIFSELSGKLNCKEKFTHNQSSDEWIKNIYDKFYKQSKDQGIKVLNFETLKEKNFERMSIDLNEEDYVPFKDFHKDPLAHPLGTPSGKIEIYSEKIANFNYPEIPGHPTYNKPFLDKNFPLRLLSPQPHDKLHSQLQAAVEDTNDYAVLVMNPKDADARGISRGDLIKIWNSRGCCLATLELQETILPGVVSMATGAWFSPGEDGLDISGNPNVLTADTGTSDLGQGSAAHNIEVQIEIYNKKC